MKSWVLSVLFALAHSGSNAGTEAATVEYEWEAMTRRSQLPVSPDCFKSKNLILVNGEAPGPTIDANVGDTIKITLTNMHPSAALTIHYHGLHMKGKYYADGSGAISQCGLNPLQSQVYEFVAKEVGTHYWHGHFAMERVDGFQGSIIIRDPENEKDGLEYDDEHVLFLDDYYHASSFDQAAGLESEPFNWIGNAQSFLIGGRGLFSSCEVDGTATEPLEGCASLCTPENSYSKYTVQRGKTYRLRIILASSLFGMNLAIANHNMTVVEADGTLTEPLVVNNLDLSPGQRYSVLVTADQPVNTYWISVAPRWRNTDTLGYAYLQYDGSTQNVFTDMPEHPHWEDVEAGMALDRNLFTKYVNAYDDSDVLTSDIDRRLIVVGTQNRRVEDNNLRWAVNNISSTLPTVPLSLSAYDAVAKADGEWPVDIPGTIELPEAPPTTWNYTGPITGTLMYLGAQGVVVKKLVKDEIVEVVLQNALALNGVAEMHPWHLHGHSFWVVGMGVGSFDEDTDPLSYNLDNPLRRDSVTLHPKGWTAIRFKASNPGVWPFHCHLSSHLLMGMGFEFVIAPNEMPPPPPAAMSCVFNSLNPEDAGSMQIQSAATHARIGLSAVFGAVIAMMNLFI